VKRIAGVVTQSGIEFRAARGFQSNVDFAQKGATVSTTAAGGTRSRFA